MCGGQMDESPQRLNRELSIEWPLGEAVTTQHGKANLTRNTCGSAMVVSGEEKWIL